MRTIQAIDEEIKKNIENFYKHDWQLSANALLGIYGEEPGKDFSIKRLTKALDIYTYWRYGDKRWKHKVLRHGALYNFPVLEGDAVEFWIDSFEEDRECDAECDGEEYVPLDWEKMNSEEIMLTLLDHIRERINPDCVDYLECICGLQYERREVVKAMKRR